MDLRNRIVTLLVIVTLATCITPVSGHQCGEQLLSEGTSFMIGMMGPPVYTLIGVMITTNTTADVRIIAPFANLDKHYTFTRSIRIQLQANLTQITNGTEFKGIELLSDVPISVVVMASTGSDYYEGFLALPTKTLSTKYIVASYHPLGGYYSEFLIVGTAGTSNVTVLLPRNYQNDAHYSGVFNVQLQKFESYQFQGPFDVSGAIITSDEPVAVFSGTQYSKIPVGKGDFQYLVEQMIPTDLWSYTYIIPSIFPRWGYVIKIFAEMDNTEVAYRNSTHHFIAFIDEGGSIELQFGQEPTIVTADHPINVVQYGYDVDGSWGDPFMMESQAVSQFQSSYHFRTQSLYTSNTLAVTIKQADISGLLYDGSRSAISSATKIPVPSPREEYVTVFFNITYNSNHVLQHNTGQLFGAMLYGLYGDTAYGYPLFLTFTAKDCNSSISTTSQPTNGNMTPTSQPTQGQGHPTDDNATRCFSCDDMNSLAYCDRVKTCTGPDEVCYVQSFSKRSDLKYYKSGCMNKQTCEAHEQGQHLSSLECTKCCSGSYCNTFGCGDDGIHAVENRGPLCFDCNFLGEHNECQLVQLCLKHQVCKVEKFRWGDDDNKYTMGCSESQCSISKRSLHGDGEELGVAKRNIPVCSHCCTTDLCNTNCTSDFTPSFVG